MMAINSMCILLVIYNLYWILKQKTHTFFTIFFVSLIGVSILLGLIEYLLLILATDQDGNTHNRAYLFVTSKCGSGFS